MTELVDTHCHIQSIGQTAGERGTRQLWAKSQDLRADGVIADAQKACVTRLICVGCDLEDSRLAVEFVQEHDGCWASIGIHPHEAKEHVHGESSSILARFAALSQAEKVVAIGECGLDYYYQHSAKEVQIKALEFQLALAQEASLPVIFHVRQAFDDFWPIFGNFKGLKGVLHSFTDSAVNLEKALTEGLLIGVNGIATFAKDADLQAVYKAVPLASLLLETDAPFLTPAPYRGSINTPQQVGIVADYLAGLRGESRDQIAANTTANARRLFGF